MSRIDFNLTNLEQRASNPDGTEGEGLSHKSGGIGGAGMVLVQVLELAPPTAMLVDGEPRGAAIIVHDIADHGRRYEALANALAQAGLIVSLPDLRGHGSSEGSRGHVPGLPEPVRDIHNVREHVAYRMPGARCVVIGIGAGALFAMAYAKAHADEVNAVVLAAPLLQPSFNMPTKSAGLLGMFKKAGPLTEGELGWTADQICIGSSEAAAWQNDPKRGSTITCRTAEVVTRAATEVIQGYKELGMQTLVLAGSDDPLSPASAAESFATQIGAEFTAVEGARHDLFRDANSNGAIERAVTWVTA